MFFWFSYLWALYVTETGPAFCNSNLEVCTIPDDIG